MEKKKVQRLNWGQWSSIEEIVQSLHKIKRRDIIMNKEQEEKIISMYSLRRSMTMMQKETGLSIKSIKDYLKEKNLWSGHRSLKYYYDEFFFDKIDTEEKAYWLGFIYADGYLTNEYSVGIEIHEKDINHVEKFRQSLKAESTVKVYHKNSTFGPQTNCRFVIRSKHMHSILLSYYGSIHKTFEGHFPKIDREDLVRHVIRGFFDGDGSITGEPKDENHLFCPQISFIGTKETLEYIENISGFSWSWGQRFPEKKTNNYQIGCGRVNDCISFLNFMYKDATIYLDRKHDRYLNMLENRERLKAKARV